MRTGFRAPRVRALFLVALCAVTTACGPAATENASSELQADPAGAPYPIVLMHGMAGFGQLEVGPLTLPYFDGVASDLAARGESVFVTVAPAFDTSDVRADAIAPQIERILARTGKRKVNLIGHSQGGLDARILASPAGHGLGDRIASITTISTPHRGSAVADAVLAAVAPLPDGPVDTFLEAFLSLMQITAYDLQADPHVRAQVTMLTERYMNEVFNPTFVDDPRVAYRSYAGRTNLRTGVFDCGDATYPNDPFSLDLAQPALAPLASYLEGGLALRVNDGLVTVDSARWGTFEQCVAADHLKEVGHVAPLDDFDAASMFRTIVARLRDEGF